MNPRIFAIDPGNVNSAYCVIDKETLEPQEFGIMANDELHRFIRYDHGFDVCDEAAVEMVQSYGMAVGKEVFDTVFWVGRFYELLNREIYCTPGIVYRVEEKVHICHDSKAKDTNIRQALIDRFAKHDTKNGKGTKKNPDWFYGFSKDIWAAYAVAITYAERGSGG